MRDHSGHLEQAVNMFSEAFLYFDVLGSLDILNPFPSLSWLDSWRSLTLNNTLDSVMTEDIVLK